MSTPASSWDSPETKAHLNEEVDDHEAMVSLTGMRFVLQSWVAGVGLKMQSILLSGFRAPDQKTSAVKKCVRWLRGNCQIDADPSKQSYMQTIPMSEELIQAAMDELEYCPVHYVHHFADSFRVMSLFHPDKTVCEFAYRIHYLVAEELFHFVPEADAVFLARHRDKIPKA